MDSLGSYLLLIINSSLSSGCVPDYFKCACVQPVLKNPGLDPTNLDHFRPIPISKLPFISNVLEKIVSKQFLEVMKNMTFSKNSNLVSALTTVQRLLS